MQTSKEKEFVFKKSEVTITDDFQLFVVQRGWKKNLICYIKTLRYI